MFKNFFKTKYIIALLLITVSVITVFSYFVITTNQAHETFEGYCKWRGLTIESKTDTYGYCKDMNSGKLQKIVLYQGKWYLDGDLPCGFLCF
jgi:hypothetical protein